MIVELWGLYPPPIGGVSIHIKRLIVGMNKKMRVFLKDFKPKEEYAYDYIIPVKVPIWEILKLPFIKKRIIHVEQFSLALFIALLVSGWKHYLGITIHNQRSILITSKIKNAICRCFFNRCRFIIMNDNKFKNSFVHFFKVKEEKIHVLPAFLPPTEAERRGIPAFVNDFKSCHTFIVSANGYRLRLDNGIDVYGLDLLVDLICQLQDEGINAGLVFCLPEVGDEMYYQSIKRTITRMNLTEHILFVEGLNDNGFEYWEISDLFIRPTCTDMEGISIKEALSVGCHVVASDVCIRPPECVLFKNRDVNDLFNKVLTIYKKGIYQHKISYNSFVDVAQETINIYKEISY